MQLERHETQVGLTSRLISSVPGYSTFMMEKEKTISDRELSECLFQCGLKVGPHGKCLRTDQLAAYFLLMVHVIGL
jgi:hypothetical protein